MKIAVTADWHLNKNNRIQKFIKSINTIIDKAIEDKVDLFVHCGDIFTDNNPDSMERMVFVSLLMKLINANIPIRIVLGNHDFSARNVFMQENAIVELGMLPISDVQVISKPRAELFKGIPLAYIPHITKDIVDKEGSYENAYKKALGAVGEASILFTHALMQGFAEGGSDVRSINPDSISGFGLVCAGDIHKSQAWTNRNDVNMLYVGSPEKITMGEAGNLQRYVCVDIDKKGGIKVNYTPIETTKMNTIDIVCNENEMICESKGSVPLDIRISRGMDFEPFKGLEKTIEGCIVSVRFSGHKAILDKIDRGYIEKEIAKLHPEMVQCISYKVTDNIAVRDNSFAKIMSDEQYLDKWIKSQKIGTDRAEKILTMGLEIINENSKS